MELIQRGTVVSPETGKSYWYKWYELDRTEERKTGNRYQLETKFGCVGALPSFFSDEDNMKAEIEQCALNTVIMEECEAEAGLVIEFKEEHELN